MQVFYATAEVKTEVVAGAGWEGVLEPDNDRRRLHIMQEVSP
jgi:hypothetical protein